MKIFLILFLGISLGVTNIYAMGDREPENSISQLRCHNEEVRSSGDDPVLENNCTRFVCGPTYVGKIASDGCYEAERIIEGEGEDAITVKTGYVRLPGRENSSEEWEEIVVQTGPEKALTCGRYFVPPEEEIPEEETSWIFDRLVPDLLAQGGSGSFSPESVIGSTDIAWSEEQKRLVADKLNELASRISTAIEANNPLEVGQSNSEFQAYTIATLETARWLAHALSPQAYPCYPTTLSGLNGLIHPGEPAPPRSCVAVAGGASFSGHGFLIYWVPCEGSNCYGAATYGLNLIKVNQNYQPSEGDTGAALANLLIHEGLHTLNHFQDAFRAESYVSSSATIPPDNTAFTLYAPTTPMGEESPLPLSEFVPPYSDESSARAAELILFHFMNDLDRSQVEFILRRIVWDPNVNFRLLRLSAHLARQNFIPPPYAYKWEWWRMSDADRLLHGNSFSAWQRRCSNFDPVKMLAELETLYHTQGGFLGLPPGYQGTAAETGAALGMSSQPGLDRNTTESPDSASLCEGPVPSSEEEIAQEVEVPDDCKVISTSKVSTASWSAPGEIPANCEPPDCEGNPEECEENPEEEPEEPDPTDEIPDCVLYYDDYLIDDGSVGASCYAWCWENANNELAPGLCEHLREDDLRADCHLSIYIDFSAECARALYDRCSTDPSFRAQCVSNCSVSENIGYCHDICTTSPDPVFCGNLCQRDLGHDLPWCVPRCEDVDRSLGYCRDLCATDDPNRPYCAALCQENLEWCADQCEELGAGSTPCREACNAGVLPLTRGVETLCRATCVALASNLPSYCREFCDGIDWSASSALCIDICEANGSIAGCDRIQAYLECRASCYTVCGYSTDDESVYEDYCHDSCWGDPSRRRFSCPDPDPPEPPPPPPPPPSGGGSDCPSGWTYPDGWQLLAIVDSECFPFVGDVKCCGSDCRPNGANHACIDGEYCGCSTDPFGPSRYNFCQNPVTGVTYSYECLWCDGTCTCAIVSTAPDLDQREIFDSCSDTEY